MTELATIPTGRTPPTLVALAVPSRSSLESHVVTAGFRCLVGAAQLLAELAQGQSRVPDLLLLRGSVEAGLAELLRLREIPALATIPILVVLSEGRREDQRACELASAFACLREPVSPEALQAAIDASLAAGARRQAARGAVADSSVLVREVGLSLRSPEEVATAVTMLSALCPQPARQALGLAELLMNAIEHGNLEISGELKAQLLARDELDAEVTRRLADPRYAARQARANFVRYPDHVELVVEDAGPGFDWRCQLEKAVDYQAPCGRGLLLARQLAFDSLDYLGRGNVAIARVRNEVTDAGARIGVSDWERRSIEVMVERFLNQLADGQFFREALRLCVSLTESTRGLIGYLDRFGLLVVPSCYSSEPLASRAPFSIPGAAVPRAWSQVLHSGSALVSDDGLGLDQVGIPSRTEPTLSVPVVVNGRVIGVVHLTGNPRGYTGLDAERLEIALAKLASVFAANIEAALAWSARQRLEESTAVAQVEQEAAAFMMQCLRGGGDADPNVRVLSAPKDVFNGDLVLSARLPGGGLRVMLADFVGHGLAAAIGGLPLSSIFHATSRKLVPLPEVVATMNDSLRGFLPGGYFCGALLLELDVKQSLVAFWNGGMPSSLLWRARTSQVTQLPSVHLPLGVVNSSELGLELSTLPVEPGDQLLVMSDGIVEFEGREGELFGLQRVERVLRGAEDQDPFDAILAALSDFSEIMTQANDDMSLIRIRVAPSEVASPRA